MHYFLYNHELHNYIKSAYYKTFFFGEGGRGGGIFFLRLRFHCDIAYNSITYYLYCNHTHGRDLKNSFLLIYNLSLAQCKKKKKKLSLATANDSMLNLGPHACTCNYHYDCHHN